MFSENKTVRAEFIHPVNNKNKEVLSVKSKLDQIHKLFQNNPYATTNYKSKYLLNGFPDKDPRKLNRIHSNLVYEHITYIGTSSPEDLIFNSANPPVNKRYFMQFVRAFIKRISIKNYIVYATNVKFAEITGRCVQTIAKYINILLQLVHGKIKETYRVLKRTRRLERFPLITKCVTNFNTIIVHEFIDTCTFTFNNISYCISLSLRYGIFTLEEVD